MALPYRARQFWNALKTDPALQGLDLVKACLSPALMALFMQMQPGEQAHSLKVFKKLTATGENSPDLLTAALLHDIGKSRYPLRLWDRVLIVFGQAFFPELSRDWGKSKPHGWKQAFVVVACHPEWGAELAVDAGASPLAGCLIRRHQDRIVQPTTLEDNLLIRLQRIDSES